MSERQAGTYARKTGTPAHNAAMALLSELRVPYKSEAFFERPGEKSPRGYQLYYFVDILCYAWPNPSLAVEVEGRGSKSRDNGERDAFLRERGMAVLHVENRTVLKDPLKFMALVALEVSKFNPREGARLALEICGRLARSKT